jgi:hypothetical protein
LNAADKDAYDYERWDHLREEDGEVRHPVLPLRRGEPDRGSDAAARGIEKMHVELKRLRRPGTAQYQQELLDEETMTRHFRIFDPALVPDALQTRGYATVRLSEFADMVGIPGDISATVAVRMERARLLSLGSDCLPSPGIT